MKIITRLTLTFTVLVACILLFFSLCAYLFYLSHRHEDFRIRLTNKAKNTTAILSQVKEVDTRLMKMIDDISVTNMNDVVVVVLDENKNILYFKDSGTLKSLMPYFGLLNWKKNEYKFIDKRLFISLHRSYAQKNYYILASAYDKYGESELSQFIKILGIVFVFSIILIIIVGYINSKKTLRPIKDIIHEVDRIKLGQRLTVENNDEIGELAINFNKLLEQIEKAFDTERMFMTNASHELRTPLTVIKGQLEVSMINQRSVEEYKKILSSINDDINNMIAIINGFLELTETNIESTKLTFNKIRLDEVLFSVKDEIVKKRKDYNIHIEFENIPDDEHSISIYGNSRLIHILIANLIDNSCKFSHNNKVTVRIGFNEHVVVLKFIDNGVGIPAKDIENVFQPLFRSNNVNGMPGSGLGLSIVNKIALLHSAKISIQSEVNIGTKVLITFQNLN